MSQVTSEIFNMSVLALLNQFMSKTRKAARKIPLFVISGCIFTLLCAAIIATEWVISYGLFSDLFGEDDAHISPFVMGFTTLIVVVAIHLLSNMSQSQFVVRVIDKLAEKLSIIYAVGMGMVLAMLLFVYFIDLLPQPSPFPFDTNEAFEQTRHWVNIVMEDYASPLAVMMFSIGAAAIVVINIFVVHHALHKAIHAFSAVSIRTKALKEDLADYMRFKSAHKTYQDGLAHYAQIKVCDEQRLKSQVAFDYLEAMESPLHQAKTKLQNYQLMNNPSLGMDAPLDIKKLEQLIKSCESITEDALMTYLN